jgi:hypothetical protein
VLCSLRVLGASLSVRTDLNQIITLLGFNVLMFHGSVKTWNISTFKQTSM